MRAASGHLNNRSLRWCSRHHPIRKGHLAVLISIISLSLTCLSTLQSGGPPGTPKHVPLDATAAPLSLNCSAILPSSEIYTQVSQVYGILANNTSAPVSTFPSPAAVSANIWNLFSGICVNPSFLNLVGTWGVSNFSMELKVDLTVGVHFANFTEAWSNWSGSSPYANVEWWSANLQLNSTVGPFLVSYLATGNFGRGPPDQGSAFWSLPMGTVYEVGIGIVIIGVLAVLTTVLVVGRRRNPAVLGPGKNSDDEAEDNRSEEPDTTPSLQPSADWQAESQLDDVF